MRIQLRAMYPNSNRALVPASFPLGVLPGERGLRVVDEIRERFLVADVGAWPVAVPVQRLAWWNFAARFNWVLDLFERLERREQFQRTMRVGR